MIEDMEVDDSEGRWCENCLAQPRTVLPEQRDLFGNVVFEETIIGEVGVEISFDSWSGRWLCEPCRNW